MYTIYVYVYTQTYNMPNASCHVQMSRTIYDGVIPCMNESCHTWMSRVIYECVMSHMNEFMSRIANRRAMIQSLRCGAQAVAKM